MTERVALYREILANPDDDFPRRIFADWLADHGEVLYADVIYAELEGAETTTLAVTADEMRRMHPKEKANKAILSVQEFRYGVVAVLLDRGFQQVKFRRGMVDWVAAPLDVLLKQGAWLVANHPVTEVQVTDKKHTPTHGIPNKWGWWDQSVRAHSYTTDELPGFIYGIIVLEPDAEVDSNWTWFRQEYRAKKVLSDAVLKYARHQSQQLTGG